MRVSRSRVVAFDSFEDFVPVSVAFWVVGFRFVLRVFLFAFLRDGFELLLALLCSFSFQFV